MFLPPFSETEFFSTELFLSWLPILPFYNIVNTIYVQIMFLWRKREKKTKQTSTAFKETSYSRSVSKKRRINGGPNDELKRERKREPYHSRKHHTQEVVQRREESMMAPMMN